MADNSTIADLPFASALSGTEPIAAVQSNVTVQTSPADIATYLRLPGTTYDTGDLLYASAANTLSRLPVESDGKVLTVSSGVPAWEASTSVSSVGQTFVGGLITVTGSPITSSGTLALTVAGTSGGIPYFSSGSAWSSSGALTNHALVLGGGTGGAPTPMASLGTTTTVLHGNASGAPTFGAVSLTADVSGVLPVANGGTNASSASITAFNNITGYTASGATGTTSTNLVFSTSPSLTTPTLGAATATSINKVAITAPATSATLTVADGKTLTANSTLTLAGVDSKTLTVNNTLTLAGTDSTTMTFPPASASIGYLNIPQNSQSTAYTTVLADAGKHVFHPSADTTARTWTIDSNANVAYPIGTAITFINQISAGAITISITSDTMWLAGAGTTGSRTLAANGVATAIKITTTGWIISGTGLT